MPKPVFYEGQTASNPQTGEKIAYHGGRWAPVQSVGTTAGDEPMAALTPGSDSRTRVALGLGPSVEAQKNLYAGEKWDQSQETPQARLGRNPLNQRNALAAAAILDESKGPPGPFRQLAGKVVGGQGYQAYVQASKSFESAFLPILSGAAVTPSEASRQIKAALPEIGDTPYILAQKAKQRAMMINAAADLAGRPRPFPKVGTVDLTTGKPAANKDAAAANLKALSDADLKAQLGL